MRGLARALAMRSLLIAAEMARFHDRCITPLRADHVYLKGPSLAQRYYAKPHLRQSRDIDILIDETVFHDVVARARDLGYRLSDANLNDIEEGRAEAEAAYVEMNKVVTLRSPEGVFFEVHRSVDRHSAVFRPREFLTSAVPMAFHGHTIRVLPTDMLFSYVAFHSAQHAWSRLNWFTDIHAILRDPQASPDTILRRGEQLGIVGMVRACLEMDALAGSTEPVLRYDPDGPAGRILDFYRRNIDGGIEAEKRILGEEHRLGLPRRFDVSRRTRARAMLGHVRSAFEPDIAIYRRFPLPRGLWWAYGLVRPVVGLARLVRMRGPGASTAGARK